MLKKEIIVYVESNEDGEFIKVNALDSDPGYYLLSLGQNRMVISGAEMVEALSTIDQYATLFAHERKIKQQRAAAPPKAIVVPTVTASRRGKKSEELEGTIVLDPALRLGPTASELALESQTKHMQGETLVITEKAK